MLFIYWARLKVGSIIMGGVCCSQVLLDFLLSRFRLRRKWLRRSHAEVFKQQVAAKKDAGGSKKLGAVTGE
jgi:hypothetical protein